MITIGVVGVQGAIKEHIDKLSKISNVSPIIVKTKEEIELVDGLILPGGESTAIGKILDEFKLMAYLKEKIKNPDPGT
jgi:5'-phosphate synthase pdxT subunit